MQFIVGSVSDGIPGDGIAIVEVTATAGLVGRRQFGRHKEGLGRAEAAVDVVGAIAQRLHLQLVRLALLRCRGRDRMGGSAGGGDIHPSLGALLAPLQFIVRGIGDGVPGNGVTIVEGAADGGLVGYGQSGGDDQRRYGAETAVLILGPIVAQGTHAQLVSLALLVCGGVDRVGGSAAPGDILPVPGALFAPAQHVPGSVGDAVPRDGVAAVEIAADGGLVGGGQWDGCRYCGGFGHFSRWR